VMLNTSQRGNDDQFVLVQRELIKANIKIHREKAMSKMITKLKK